VIGAAINPLRTGGPFALRKRSTQETMDRWVVQLARGWETGNGDFPMFAELSGAADNVERLLEIAREAGMVRGLRKGRHEDVLTTIGILYVGAGIALFDTATSRWDSEEMLTRATIGI
jgi:hypothetical protein